jgi:hypothetical protein
MGQIKTVAELKAAITYYENKKKEDAKLMKEQLHLLYESLKPGNIIKNSLHEFVSGPDLKNGLVNTGLGIAAGYLSKKIMIGKTFNPIKMILGRILQTGVTKVVSKNADGIKDNIINVFSRLFAKKQKAL